MFRRVGAWGTEEQVRLSDLPCLKDLDFSGSINQSGSLSACCGIWDGGGGAVLARNSSSSPDLPAFLLFHGDRFSRKEMFSLVRMLMEEGS